jgi:uncharacterized protein YceK
MTYHTRFVLLSLLLVPVMAGCATVYSRQDRIRTGEERLKISFESEAASSWFHRGMDQARLHKGTVADRTVLAVPFITLYRRESVLSDNAFFNDQVRRCDVNGDLKITEAEARVYFCPELTIPRL